MTTADIPTIRPERTSRLRATAIRLFALTAPVAFVLLETAGRRLP